MSHQRIQQTTTLEERLEEEARRFRKEARGTPPGVERERLIYSQSPPSRDRF